MVQDSLGFIWVGTIDGLNLYDGYKYRHYKYDPDDKNTISNNDISSLAIQKNRYLWIGTRGGGANRMDLCTGKIVCLSYDLFDGRVHCIFVDANNTVWIGTSSGLLKCIEDKENGTLHLKNISAKAVYRRSSNEPFIPDKLQTTVNYIYQSAANKLLIGAGVGVFEFNIDKKEFHQISYHLNYFNGISGIKEDKSGNLWVSHSIGVSKITGYNDGTNITRTDYSSEAASPRKINHDRIESMVVDKEGRVWLGTQGSGLVLVDKDSVININNIVNPSSIKLGSVIHDLLIDREGRLWIGQESYPLVIIDPNTTKFKSVIYSNRKDDALSDISVQSITGNRDKLWVGTSLGIDVYKFENNNLIRIDSIPDKIDQKVIWKDNFHALYCDRDSILWTGASTNSLVGIKPDGEIIRSTINGYVYAITEDHQNRIWFSTWGQGIGYLNKNTWQKEQYNLTPKQMMGLSSDVIYSLFLDSKGYLWIGTKGGGLDVALLQDIVDRKGQFVSFMHKADENTSISYNDVYDIIEARDGTIWVATGRGINKVRIPDNLSLNEAIQKGLIKFEHISEKDGLPSDMVLSIREDNSGNLWLGTNKGLCRLVPETKHITVYNEKDGLPSVNFYKNAAYKDTVTGNLFFGGLNGMTYFQPDSIKFNPSLSRPRLTEIKIQNKTITPQTVVNGRHPLKHNIFFTKHIRLKYNENDLSFEFSALNYTYSDKIRYSYRLIGYNDSWFDTDSKNRNITYTNLSPGSYTLEIRATNSDGTWAQNHVSLNIDITPPFWLTWWAISIYSLLFLSLLVIFHRYSIIAVNEKNRLKLARFEQDKKDEIFEAKTRFFINVSHEIRTPLTLINEPLNQLLDREELSAGAIESAKMIRRNLKRLLNQVNQLLEFRKMEENKYTLKYSEFHIEEVIKDIVTEFEAIVRHKEIGVQYIFPENYVIEADKKLIETIIYNLVSNSMKHLAKHGELKIELQTKETNPSLKQGMFKLLVADNGPGIPEEDIEHVFERFYQPNQKNNLNTGGTGIGLSIVNEYVEQHNGHVKAYNLNEGGCCFEISIPVKGEGKIIPEENIPTPSKTITTEKKEDIENYFFSLSKRSLSMVIIEDDLDLSVYLRETFDKQFKVTVFMDGLEASEKITESSPDIIICDLMLPGMNGLDLTAKLKEDPETSHIPVIMLTAIHEEESMTKGLVSGADCYLTKPFNTNALKAQVVSIIKSREKFKERFSKDLVLEPTEDVIIPREEKFIKKILQITESRLEDTEFEVSDIVKEMAMSHSLLLKKFKTVTGMSLVEFIRSMRIKKATQLFKQDKFTVAEVAYKVGFSDPKYFSKCFYNEMDERPSEYIKKYHS